LASAGIPGFPESCELGFKIGPLSEMSGYEARYDAWCGPCIDRGGHLHTAAGTNNCERTRQLLEEGAVVNSCGGGDRELPIHHAARLGCLDTAMLLIDHGADVDARNSYGNTVLQYACFRHPYDELVKKTSGIDKVADYVENVNAARHNLRAMLTLLILAGADVECGGDHGCTAMQRLKSGGAEDPVAISILDHHQTIWSNGLTSPEEMAELLEANPGLKSAKGAFKLLLERDGGAGFEWAARMQARRCE